jgi:GT2 family glycosyltransferase
MKIALFTLCKDRLHYTQRSFESLRTKTQIPFDHFVLDQNSQDDTVRWLKHFTYKQGKLYVYPLAMNIGINRGVNFLIDKIGKDYDIIVKVDNDVVYETKGWLDKCLRVLKPKMLISPYVKGLIDNRGGVDRIGYIPEAKIGLTPFIGGICMIGLKQAWSKDSGGWEFPVPKHAGGDKAFCGKLSLAGYRFGYVEDVIIKHIETTFGQYERYPEYFIKRKVEKTEVF